MSEIVSIGKLSDARIAELAEQGVDVKKTFDLDELNLPEPAHGEMFCFHAEPEETAIFEKIKRNLSTQIYEVPPRARRHLAKPILRF